MKRSSAKFKLAFCLSLTLLFSIGFYFFSTQVVINDSTRASYKELLNKTNPSNIPSELAPYTAKQERKKVRKNFFYEKKDERLQLQLESSFVELALNRKDAQLEMVENMQDVTCTMQEDLFFVLEDGRELKKAQEGKFQVANSNPADPSSWLDGKQEHIVSMQRMRSLKAKHATYNYHTDRLLAEDAFINFYILPGHDFSNPLKEKPYASFWAKHIDTVLRGKNQIFFSKEVSMKHELGNINAGQVKLTPSIKSSNNAILELSKKVDFFFKEGGELHCYRAYLTEEAKKGFFWGEQGFVTYKESIQDKKSDKKTPLLLESKFMTLFFSEPSKQRNKHHQAIERLEAEGQVRVQYGDEILALADMGTYLRPPSSFEKGEIVLKAHKKSGICQATDRNGDIINAHNFYIDLDQQNIQCENPYGIFYINKDSQQSQKVNFKAGILLWDAKDNHIFLKKDVSINQEGIGSIASDNEVSFKLASINGKKQLVNIRSKGISILKKEDNEEWHNITCYGILDVDQTQGLVSMSSPENEGAVLEGMQVHFKDSQGEIFADKVLVKYECNNKKFMPKKIILEGHVRIYNENTPGVESQKSMRQYALADRLEYFPHDLEMYLKASNGNRVLFYDKINNVQVSAPALKITRNALTKKETIKGIGDVRFSFIEHEFEQLRQRFSFTAESK